MKRFEVGEFNAKLSANVAGYKSVNRPTPPRMTVFDLPHGFQAKPMRGWNDTFSISGNSEWLVPNIWLNGTEGLCFNCENARVNSALQCVLQARFELRRARR